MLIDTHCHLNFKAFENQVGEVIKEAEVSGIGKIIVPGSNLETSYKAVEIAKKYKNVYAAVGIHPHHSNIKNQKLKIKNEFARLVKYKRVVAIGECGLDYSNIKNQILNIKNTNEISNIKNRQRELFLSQIELAIEFNLPLIVHNREASDDVLKLLTAYGLRLKNIKGVIHCFQGNEKLWRWAIDNGFFIGITGIVSWDKEMQTIVKKTPLERLLVETDAPFLLPEPLRQQKKWPNTPKNVKIVGRWIAKIKGDPLLKIADQTSKNAIQLFKL